MGGKGDRPTVENRWWVDQGKEARSAPARQPAPFGRRFFRAADGFEQESARLRLTDSNLRWIEEANPPPGTWGLVQTLPGERFARRRLERVRSSLRLPPDCRGVLIDSGVALRAVAGGIPAGERVVELRLGDESSFDAWVNGEWVCEVLFRNFDDALRRGPRLLREYLTTTRGAPLA